MPIPAVHARGLDDEAVSAALNVHLGRVMVIRSFYAHHAPRNAHAAGATVRYDETIEQLMRLRAHVGSVI